MRLIIAAIVVAIVLSACRATPSCHDSDQQLLHEQGVNCASYVGSIEANTGDFAWCPTNGIKSKAVHKDWPAQAVYTQKLLSTLAAPTTCLNTTVATNVTRWLDDAFVKASVPGSFGWTILVFQPMYYEMPRKAGDRIESPWTLGLKCWAAAFLQQTWATIRDPFVHALKTNHDAVSATITTMDHGTQNSVKLCGEVMANCFVNATYDPALRNGTCPLAVDEFRAGFDWENALHGTHIHFGFW